MEANRWDLVPGELFGQQKWRTQNDLTRQQHDEMMYYAPCGNWILHMGNRRQCGRTIASIRLTGCIHCNDPSPASVEGALDAWCDRLDAALRIEAEENAVIQGGIKTELGPLATPPFRDAID